MLLIFAVSFASARPTLLRWVARLPGAAVGPISLAPSDAASAAACLTEAARDGDLLFAVPMEAAITLHTALSDAAIGLELRNVWEHEGERAATAGFVAAHLLDPSSFFAPYLATLPARTADLPQHVLWWDAHEVALLDGTTAARECASIRDEVDDVCRVLRDGALSSLVAAHGDDAVDEAVRRAFAALFSRAFDLPDAFDLGTCLVPLLDCLQHSAAPSVRYGWARRGGERRLEGRAVGSLAAGTELSISYGEHPDMVFGSHYGFVPPLLQQPSSCYTVLRLGDELADGGMGAAAVLAAQHEAEERRLDDDASEDDDAAGAWRGCGRRRRRARLAAPPQPPRARSPSASRRRTSTAQPAALRSRRWVTRGSGSLDALRACARLCALTSGGAPDDDDAQTDAAVRAVLNAGSVGAANDADAARLVEAAAAAVAALESSAGDAAAAVGAAAAARRVRRDGVGARASEAIVLRRLADGEAAALFSGWRGFHEVPLLYACVRLPPTTRGRIIAFMMNMTEELEQQGNEFSALLATNPRRCPRRILCL